MKNSYKPFKVKIAKIEDHSEDVKLFRLQRSKGRFRVDKQGVFFNPGQFVLLSHFGYGEAPFGIASSPYQTEYLDLVIRKAGCLTNALHQLKQGQEIFMRGPYGNGFPVNFFSQKDILMITGGCGIPPIAALIEYIFEHRNNFGNCYLIYGAKTPNDLLMKDKLKVWQDQIKVILTVNEPTKDWQGEVGLVTKMIKQVRINHLDAVCAMCGPGPMMEAIEKVVRPLGISDRRIFVNMERKMQCGIGKCQHCSVGEKLVCQDGPVFNFDEIDKSWD